MSLFRKQIFVTKEMISDWTNSNSTFEYHIKRRLILEIFNDFPTLLDGATISYSFVIFDWNSEPDELNRRYHHIIEKCKQRQSKFFEINVNIIS